MKKTAFFVGLFLVLGLSAHAKSLTEIDREIAGAKNRLQQKASREESLQSRVDKLSQEITAANRELDKLDQNLKNNAKSMARLESGVKEETNERERLARQRDRLLVEKEAIEKKLIDLLANHLAQSLVLSKSEPVSEADLVRQELFESVKARSSREIESLQKSYRESDRQLQTVSAKIKRMQNRLEELAAAQARQSEMLAEQSRLVAALDKRKNSYLADLNTLIEQKNRERQMLADLRIVRQRTVDGLKQQQLSRQEATRREAEARAQSDKRIAVKQYGTSYQQAGKSDYRGRKVRAPLDDRLSVSLIKEFGPYTDPIYNIKIHNDSVTLRADQNDAVVRSVLPGKVVFADEHKLLGRVVIVEHSGNMHTIYRNLKVISPNIQVDRTIKARESIGRVAQELVFEVTKDGLPINPLQLIALK